MAEGDVVRIASGQGFWGDDPEAPVRQVEGGPIDYLMMDYLAEVTMVILQKQRQRDPSRGFAADFLQQMRDALLGALGKYDMDHLNANMALALSISGQPDYGYIRKLAESIAGVVDMTEDPSAPLFVVVDVDVAKSLGGILREEIKLDRALIAVDGIDVGDLDYIDIGKPMGVSEVIPVTVKSLIFALRSASG